MNELRFKSKGQVIVIFVLAIAALLIVGALVIDGGQAYMNRRAAQSAADAGALAGAHEYCYNGTANVKTVAQQYAQTENYSTSAFVTMNADDTITVDVTIEQKNFLAQLFGRPETTVEATATAGCYHPGAAMHLMPIAWSCRAPVAQSISGTCQAKGLDWATQLKALIDGEDVDGNMVPYVEIDGIQYLTPHNFGKNGGIVDNRVYIVMDSDKAGIDHCKEIPGGGDELTCDLDGDGAIDLLGSGDRSWLDLDKLNLKKSIENFYDTTISVHTWAPGETGVNAAVLDTIDQVIIQKGSIVMVPVI
ncbi:MAG TPA: pilus assembly protein TadG-related protein, partial [Anaerolineaceae bacterium]|nr:pilus assembly protein TadG-related protein [Anaerolineaceae bacterium]